MCVLIHSVNMGGGGGGERLVEYVCANLLSGLYSQWLITRDAPEPQRPGSEKERHVKQQYWEHDSKITRQLQLTYFLKPAASSAKATSFSTTAGAVFTLASFLSGDREWEKPPRI